MIKKKYGLSALTNHVANLTLLPLLCCGLWPTMALAATYTQIAPGGGGSCPTAAISPHNNNVIISANNMSGVFRSADGGTNWTLLSATNLFSINYYLWDALNNLNSPVAFTRVNQNTVYASARKGLYKSTNQGVMWQLAMGVDTEGFSNNAAPGIIAVSENDKVMVSWQNIAGTGDQSIWTNGPGATGWGYFANYGKDNERVVGLLFDDFVSPTNYVVATESNIWYSNNGGKYWSQHNSGLPVPGKRILQFSGSSLSDGPRIMYVTVETTDASGVCTPAVYRSTNSGNTWTVCTNGLYISVKNGVVPSYATISICQSDPTVAYVCYEGRNTGNPSTSPGGDGGLFKTTDSGGHWTEVLFTHEDNPRFNCTTRTWKSAESWQCSVMPETVCVAPNDPNMVIVSQGGPYLSRDGGTSWRDMAAAPLDAQGASPAGQLPVLSVWHFHSGAEPADTTSRFCYLSSTDFALFYSKNWGGSWFKISDNCFNNVYDIEVNPGTDADGQTPEVWVAGGWTHDIPTWKWLQNITTYKGGILYTANNFATAPVLYTNGLPGGVVCDLWLDPTTPQNNRTLWAAVIGYGFYKSTNHGQNWSPVTALNAKLVTAVNSNAYKIGKTPDGRMYALVTAARNNAWGQLYTLEGTTWQTNFPTSANIVYPVNVTFHPTNSSTYYVAGFTRPNLLTKTGGVWKTTNSGASWTKMFEPGCADVALQPDRLNVVYVTAQDGSFPEATNNFGLFSGWQSSTPTSGWTRDPGFGFANPWKITFNGAKDKIITGFGGGVWCEQP